MRRPVISKRGYTLVSGLVSTLIIAPGVVFVPTGVGKALVFVVGAATGAVINLVAGNASIRS